MFHAQYRLRGGTSTGSVPLLCYQRPPSSESARPAWSASAPSIGSELSCQTTKRCLNQVGTSRAEQMAPTTGGDWHAGAVKVTRIYRVTKKETKWDLHRGTLYRECCTVNMFESQLCRYMPQWATSQGFTKDIHAALLDLTSISPQLDCWITNDYSI